MTHPIFSSVTPIPIRPDCRTHPAPIRSCCSYPTRRPTYLRSHPSRARSRRPRLISFLIALDSYERRVWLAAKPLVRLARSQVEVPAVAADHDVTEIR